MIEYSSIKDITEYAREFFKLSPGFDIEKLVGRLGGEVKISSSAIFPSVEKKGENTFKILLTTSESKFRQRFSVAHELGHLLLHMGFGMDPEKWSKIEGPFNDSAFFRSGDFSLEEAEADQFAGCLLMPEDEIRDFHSSLKQKSKKPLDKEKFFQKVSKKFNVSIGAAAVRSKNIDLY